MKHNRWCEWCNQFHWPLYICDKYSEELKQEINDTRIKFREKMMDKNYIDKMIDDWVPKEAIAVMQMFAWITK